MAKYIKHIQAGRFCYVTTFPVITKKDSPRARAEKRHASTEAQKLVNDRNSRIALTSILAENFVDSPTALFVTPTFDNDHYPVFLRKSEYWTFCRNQTQLYIKRLRRLVNRRGGQLKYVYSFGIGEGGRWHIHLLIDGATPEDVRDTWGLGDVDYHHLYTDRKWISDREWYTMADNVNPVAIAKYMMHNANFRMVGQHPWHASRNCIRPKATPAAVVPDNVSIEPPSGSEILDRESVETLYSKYQAIEYILPETAPAKKRGGKARAVMKSPPAAAPDPQHRRRAGRKQERKNQ